MDTYKETFETWNKVAKLYEDKFMHIDLFNDTYHRFCELLGKANSSVLEIGCGARQHTAKTYGIICLVSS